MRPNHEFLLDVFPVSGVQSPCNVRETCQEKQDPNAQRDTFVLRRLGHPLHVVDEIANSFVVLLRRHRAGRDLLPAGQDVRGLTVLLALFKNGLTLALKLPLGIGHAHVRESQIVPTRWLGFIAVIRAQVGVEVVGTCAAVA